MKIGQRYKMVRNWQRNNVEKDSSPYNKDDIDLIAIQYIFGKPTSIDSTRPTIVNVTESKVTEMLVPTKTLGNQERFQGMLEKHPPHEFLITHTSTTASVCCQLSRIDVNIRNLRRVHAQEESDTVVEAEEDKSKTAQKRLNNLIKPIAAKKKTRTSGETLS